MKAPLQKEVSQLASQLLLLYTRKANIYACVSTYLYVFHLQNTGGKFLAAVK